MNDVTAFAKVTDQAKFWLQELLSIPEMEVPELIAVILWAIWGARNKELFDQATCDPMGEVVRDHEGDAAGIVKALSETDEDLSGHVLDEVEDLK
ncbi:hypothetical protein ACH5RR_013567 [Cinchona calisaya]|uniref:Uncharacterized protein n=1 Tax=Cinchona calisaya TaxID=153742 RepID=A0ABD3A3T1_9GENT